MNDTDGFGDMDAGYGGGSPSGGDSSVDSTDNSPGVGDDSGGYGPGGWESQVAEKGYSSLAGQTSEDADPGAMAAMGEVLGRSASDISVDLAMEFGFKGVVEAYDRYGLAEAISAFAKSQISTAVSAIVGFVVEKSIAQLAFTVASKVNPKAAIAVALVTYTYSMYRASKASQNLSAEIDAAVRGRGSASVTDIMSEIGMDIGSDGSGNFFEDMFSDPEIVGMTLAELDKLVQSEVDTNSILYRRRSNIIGTGRMGLTID